MTKKERKIIDYINHQRNDNIDWNPKVGWVGRKALILYGEIIFLGLSLHQICSFWLWAPERNDSFFVCAFIHFFQAWIFNELASEFEVLVRGVTTLMIPNSLAVSSFSIFFESLSFVPFGMTKAILSIFVMNENFDYWIDL